MATREALRNIPLSRRARPDLMVAPKLFAWRKFVLPGLVFAGVTAYFVIRTTLQVTVEGDGTLHLHIMELISKGQLPTTVPYFAAIVGQGGEVEAFFPYSYTPLYHFFGAAVFKVGGESAVLMMGPFFAGLIAVSIVYLLKPHSWPIAVIAVALVFLQWITQPVFTWVYMEPMMLVFFFAALVFYQRAWSTYSLRDSMLAGIFLGLAVATRQSALFYVTFVAVHGTATLAFEAYRGFERPRFKAALQGYAVMALSAVVVAAPFLLYLISNTGTIGYGEFSLPGLGSSLPVNPEANDYISSISAPSASAWAWMNDYWHWTLYTTRWQVQFLTYLPITLFGVGSVHLWTRQSMASKFLATYIPIHVLGEMVQFMTVHGNWRYIIASRLLFYIVVAVGVWYVVTWMYRLARDSVRWNPSLAGAAGVAGAALAVAALAPAFVTPSLVSYLVHQEEDRAEKGRSFKELGVYVQENVPEDALILSGRWYTSGYYLRRNYTWVTFFGNTWVIDAISNTEPEAVRTTLAEYGVDYIVFGAPPPSYIDRMPSGGLRSIVLDDLDHFQLLFKNERTRFYRFWPNGIVEEEPSLEQANPGELGSIGALNVERLEERVRRVEKKVLSD